MEAGRQRQRVDRIRPLGWTPQLRVRHRPPRLPLRLTRLRPRPTIRAIIRQVHTVLKRDVLDLEPLVNRLVPVMTHARTARLWTSHSHGTPPNTVNEYLNPWRFESL